MAGNSNTRLLRKDVANLKDDEKDKLVFAFYKVQQEDPGMPPNLNENSFYVIAGYHGQPFRGGGYTNREWWGGYCHHGNVLFPTWHRAYLRCLEKALNQSSGYSDVAIPYWNEFSDKVPDLLTDKTYTFSAKFPKARDIKPEDNKSNDGSKVTINNPLFSYKLQRGFFDKLARTSTNKEGTETKKVDYSKHKDYETVRCPYSGLVGPDDRKTTEQHNSLITEERAKAELQNNVTGWLSQPSKDKIPVPGMSELYVKAATLAPNYTVFSNTTSAAKWNDDNFGGTDYSNANLAIPLEKPHNGVHLAVGGYSLPEKDKNRPSFDSSNGDMGENDTAAFDPIFFFHHCFVDYVFWLWQKNHKATDTLTIIEDYPGTSPIDGQGPTPFTPADSHLSMDTPLIPFKNAENRYLKSTDVVNINKYGYAYEEPRINPTLPPSVESAEEFSAEMPVVRLSGISRAQRQGSFVVGVWAKPEGASDEEKALVGIEPVFSRWHVPGCSNCSNSLEVTAHMKLPSHLGVFKKSNTTLAGIEPAKRVDCARKLDFTIEILQNVNRDASGLKTSPAMESLVALSANVDDALPAKAWIPPDNRLDIGPTIEVMPAMSAMPA